MRLKTGILFNENGKASRYVDGKTSCTILGDGRRGYGGLIVQENVGIV